MDRALRYFLPAYLAAYFFAAFFWRSFVVWERTGVNPLVFKGTDNAHDYIGRVFKLLFGAIVVAVAVYSTSERLYQYLTPIAWLEHRWLQGAGYSYYFLRSRGRSWRRRRWASRGASASTSSTGRRWCVIPNPATRDDP